MLEHAGIMDIEHKTRKCRSKCKIRIPKCKYDHRIASKVQKLHFGRGRSIAHSAKESDCNPEGNCCGDR